MRKYNVKKQFWFDRLTAQNLEKKARKCGVNESSLIRVLVNGYEPREKPDDRFYEVMRQLSAIGNSANQIARRANALGFIDAPYYQKEAEQWHKFQLEVKAKFLLPSKEKE